MKPLETHYFDCACYSPEHTLRFVFDPDYGDLYTEIYLCQFYSWYKRLWLAVKYVFGVGENREGHFDSWMLRQGDCNRLIGLLQQAKAKQEETELQGGNQTSC